MKDILGVNERYSWTCVNYTKKLEKNVVIYFAIVCNLYDDVYHTPYK